MPYIEGQALPRFQSVRLHEPTSHAQACTGARDGYICRFNSLYYRDHTITINILYRTSTYRRYNYLRVYLHLSNMMIDVDGSPTGYVAWYNYHTEASRIRPLRAALKNDKFGVQRMEMLAIYFALADNYIHFKE